MTDLITRLRRISPHWLTYNIANEAADALEKQAKRIAELEEELRYMHLDSDHKMEGIAHHYERAERAEAEAAVFREQSGHWHREFLSLVDRTAGKNVLRLEAELAAARGAVDSVMAMADIWLGGSFSPEERLLYWRQWKLENAAAISAIAAARGEQPASPYARGEK